MHSANHTAPPDMVRRLLWIDLGVGVAVAVALLTLTPGLAIVAIAAIPTLGYCSVSLGRRRRRAGASS